MSYNYQCHELLNSSIKKLIEIMRLHIIKSEKLLHDLKRTKYNKNLELKKFHNVAYHCIRQG